jgi:hypothetical protein
MKSQLNRKTWTIWLSMLALAALGVTWTMWLSGLASVVLGLRAMRLPPALAQRHVLATPLAVPLNGGWTRLAWVPAVQGPLAFTTTFISPDNTANLTLPALLTFTVSAQVNCPRTGGDVVVKVKVYDSNRLILSQPYSVSCAYRPVPLDPSAIPTADDYPNDPHYLHVSVPIAQGGAHNLVVVTDLATQDHFYWGYVRVDMAPGVPPASTSEALRYE